MAEHWMQEAFGHNKGGLHRATHTPEGQKIPAGKMQKALHSKDPHVEHMAQAAANANGIRKKKKFYGE